MHIEKELTVNANDDLIGEGLGISMIVYILKVNSRHSWVAAFTYLHKIMYINWPRVVVLHDILGLPFLGIKPQ
jgi:hypothetical protein